MPRICVPAMAERREADSADPWSRLQGRVCSRMVPNSHRRSPKTTVGAGFAPSNRTESLRGGTIQTCGWASLCGGESVRRQHARVISRSRSRSPSPIRSHPNVSAEVTLGGPSWAWRAGVSGAAAHPFSPYSSSFLGVEAGGHRQPPSPEPILLAHFLVLDISRRGVRDLSHPGRLAQAPLLPFPCGDGQGGGVTKSAAQVQTTG
jgi:hypothetical protein